MTKCWVALLIAITTSGCASAAPPMEVPYGRTAVIFGTVGQSEWCPAGNVRIDLESGTYAFTARAPRTVCQNHDLQRPIAQGRLDVPRLQVLKEAYEQALADGLDICRGGARRDDEFIVSNGGLHVLVVTSGRATYAAPTDLSCWTDGAWALHDLLDETFPSST